MDSPVKSCQRYQRARPSKYLQNSWEQIFQVSKRRQPADRSSFVGAAPTRHLKQAKGRGKEHGREGQYYGAG